MLFYWLETSHCELVNNRQGRTTRPMFPLSFTLAATDGGIRLAPTSLMSGNVVSMPGCVAEGCFTTSGITTLEAPVGMLYPGASPLGPYFRRLEPSLAKAWFPI